jgi:hypothetical protein
MKLQDFKPPNSILVVRGIKGKSAELAKAGESIPVPSRGISWWAYKKGNPTVEDIIQEFEIRRTYGEGGVIIKTTVSYIVRGGWLWFEPSWGFGIENEDSIPDEMYEEIEQRGVKRFGYGELLLPEIPLKSGGTSFNDQAIPVWNGLVCSSSIVKYDLV